MLYYVSNVSYTAFFRWFDLIILTYVSHRSSLQAFKKVQWRWDHNTVSKTLGNEHSVIERNILEERSSQYIRHFECWLYFYLQVTWSSRCYVVTVTDGMHHCLCLQKAVRSDTLRHRPLVTMEITAGAFISKASLFFFLTRCKLISRNVTVMWGISWSIKTNAESKCKNLVYACRGDLLDH
jgi:hypothetical protein